MNLLPNPHVARRDALVHPRAARLRSSLPSVRSVWAIFALVALATVVTYWRLPAQSTYHFADHGASGAGSRLVSYLSYPVALAAIAVAWAACRRRDALIVTALCATVALPGVVSSSDLTASWAQAPSAAGVVLAFALTLRSDARVELSRWRWAALGLLAVWSIPWLFAAWGLYVSDVPGLGSVFMSHQPTPGERSLPAVHPGLHDGLFGAQLAATALILSAARLPRALLFYLALLLVYGLGLAVQDGWSEQVVKRGWSGTQIPDLMQPSISWQWAVILVLTIGVYLAWSREARGG